ncbi:tetratricopeptide repeat protein [Fulvivirga ulvae]|uniref:tetratricopeptide repeat protein n=1 Tax=Fulvivirga ulvae TaxID=2904245 RepID=UPI001F1DF962|nr:tetratricopeptide repeat protein [Fulvivirga ulvae]UII30581.1 tetratricopeptide repeat protein [Fulvivirga ulvae]
MAKPTPAKILFPLIFLLTFSLYSTAQDNAKHFFNKGYYNISVDRTAAIDYLTKCIEIDSIYTDAFFHRGICFFKEGQYELALDDFDRAFALNSDLAIIWMYRGFTYRNMGKTDEALNSFSRYITLNPRDTSAYSYILRGKMKYELGDFTGAVEDYDMALKLKPFEEKYQYYRFVALYESEMYHKALRAADRLTKINPDFYGYYFYKGNIYTKLDRLDSAIYMYNISIIKNYQNADGYFYRAQAYQQKGDLNKALEDYNTAIELNPDDGSYYSKRGNCKLEKSDKTGACKDWEEAGSLGYYEDFDKVKKVCE